MGRLPSLFTAAVLTLAAVAPLPAQSGRFDLVVTATTDVHGRLRGWDYYANAADPARSLAGAATIVDSVRTANPGRVLLLDGGDLLSGNPLLYVAAKVAPPPVHPMIAAMNVMHYDAAVVGITSSILVCPRSARRFPRRPSRSWRPMCGTRRGVRLWRRIR